MARNTGNRVTVAGTVEPELFDFIDNKHWELHKTRSEVVGDVLLEWAKGQGFVPTETGEVPAEQDGDAKDDAPADDSSEEGGPQAPEPTAAPARSRATRAK